MFMPPGRWRQCVSRKVGMYLNVQHLHRCENLKSHIKVNNKEVVFEVTDWMINVAQDSTVMGFCERDSEPSFPC